METVRVTIQTRANGTDIPKPEKNEYKIQTLRMYVFSDESKLVGYHYAVQASSDPITFTLKLPTGTHTFYTIANESAAGEIKKNNAEGFIFPEPTNTGSAIDLEALGRQISPDILKSLTFSELPEATYVSGGDATGKDETGKIYISPVLPMASMHVGRVYPNGAVNIALTRSVAKMQLYFTTTGAGECYMGRGLYLYNEPQYGYLFPQDTYGGPIDRKEATINTRPGDYANNDFYKDSYNNQLNGRIILHSGWPEEPESYTDEEHTEDMLKLDINRITADLNDPNNPQYDYLPPKSFYLFANPNRIADKATVTTGKPDDTKNGYYLKILVHQHGAGQIGAELHKGEMFYLSLPAVKANDRLSIYSVVSLDGHVSITPHWMIQEWQTGGGDITFN